MATNFDWEEIRMFVTEPSYSNEEIKEPCIDCIGRAMCINKNWMKILDGCEDIVDYISETTQGSNRLEEVYGEMAEIKSIGQIFTVHIGTKANILLIGKYWSPTIKKDGYIDDKQLGLETQHFKIHKREEK